MLLRESEARPRIARLQFSYFFASDPTLYVQGEGGGMKLNPEGLLSPGKKQGPTENGAGAAGKLIISGRQTLLE